MFGNDLLFWYCMLPLIASSLNIQPNSTSDGKKDDYSTVQFGVNTARNYEQKEDLIEHENATEINRNMQYGINSTNNNHEDDDKTRYKFRENDEKKNHKNNSQTYVESRTNSTDTDGTKDVASQEIHENSMSIKAKDDSSPKKFLKTFNIVNRKSNTMPYKICDNITCINLCCPLNTRLINGKCIAMHYNLVAPLKLYIYINDMLQIKSEKVDQSILLIINDPCENDKYLINPLSTPLLKNEFLIGGALYLPFYDLTIETTSYCLAVDGNRVAVNICLESYQKIINTYPVNKPSTNPIDKHGIIFLCCYVGTILLSLMTFIVYYIAPEFRNAHGFVLRMYSCIIFINDIVEIASTLKYGLKNETFLCNSAAFIKSYCNSTYVWLLNVMSFDMWRTFREFPLSQENTKQQERKKLIVYSAYGLGIPLIFSIIIAIMEFAPDISQNLIRPGFNRGICWFYGTESLWLYYYGIEIIFVLVNGFSSILMRRKIAHFEKDNQLTDSENHRYKNIKQRFKQTVKISKILSIIIFMKSYGLIFLSISQSSEAMHTIANIIVILHFVQNLCIHLTFVWKKNVRKQMFKQFGCQNCFQF